MRRMQDVTEALRRADALASEHQWGAAAVLYAQAAGRAMKANARAEARQAYEAAGEAWRRDDRPLHAAQALGLALEMAPQGQPGAMVRIKLAGVLGELGDAETALRLCRDAAGALVGPLRAVALDTSMDGLLTLGRKEEAKRRLEEIRELNAGPEQEGPRPLDMALWFREGQLLRLDGSLAEATTRFGLVLTEVGDHAAGLPAVASAEAELGDIALLRGDDAALDLYAESARKFEEAGRRALAWRAEAGRVRAAVAAGVQPLLNRLDEGIAEASSRQMVVLEADLRAARGIALAELDPAAAARDLDAAIAVADRLKQRWRAGRARMEHARRLPGTDEQRLAMLERAEHDLTGNEPWLARTRLARAWLLARDAPDTARPLALGAVARLTLMEMDRDAAEARRLVRQLSP